MITITRKGLTLSINASIIPAQGSSNVPVQYIDDKDTYAGFTPQLSVGWITYNGLPKAAIMQQDDDSNYLIPAEAFKNAGNIYIAVALVNDENPNHIEYTLRTQAIVNPAPNGTIILPSDDEWQKIVKDYMDELFEKNYGPQFEQIHKDLENLVTEVQDAVDISNEASQKVETAYQNMGDYKVENGIIYFKKADGSWNEEGIALAGQSTILDGFGSAILSGNITPQDNIFLNSDFRYGAINQQGKTLYSEVNKYTVDMWKLVSGSLDVNSDSITINGGIVQFFNLIMNGHHTIVVNSLSGTGKITFLGSPATFEIKKGLNKFNFNLYDIKGVGFLGENLKISFAKCEAGNVYTGMKPYDYSIELAKIQKRFITLNKNFSGYVMNNILYIICDNLQFMYKEPEIKYSSDAKITLFDDKEKFEYNLRDFTIHAKRAGYIAIQGAFQNWNNYRVSGFITSNEFFADAYDY